MSDILVAGAGFGGIFSALKLNKKGFNVKLIDKNSFHLFKPDIVFLPRGKVEVNQLKLDLESFLPNGIEFVQDKISEIDHEERKVISGRDSYDYEKLVLGLGGEAANYGLDLSSAYSIYDLDQMVTISNLIDEVEKVFVVGSGYSGVELAAELDLLGVDVGIVDSSEIPMKNSNIKSSKLVYNYLNNKGIEFVGNSRVVNIEDDSLELQSGEVLNSDLTIWAGGLESSKVVQNSFGVGSSGLPVDSDFSALNYEDLFAVGDNVDHRFLKTGQNARKQGKLVGFNVSKSKSSRKLFKEGNIPLLVNLGNKAVLEYGNYSYKSRFFSWVKRLVRDIYLIRLKSLKVGS